ncbi:hypothetical protein [Pedobacter jamesrossensis]|uniref:Uncharacterized protein n=1 Tax=Pedobacter jamesrossensis TaxID=1908238 RepID=A0ABV8NIM6_9SPHI
MDVKLITAETSEQHSFSELIRNEINDQVKLLDDFKACDDAPGFTEIGDYLMRCGHNFRNAIYLTATTKYT